MPKESEEKDYFEDVKALEPRKRRLSRLENNRILRSIAKYRKGYELDWETGKVSFMKSYETKIYPRWFASPKDTVHLQVSIRLIPGNTSDEAPVEGLSGLEVYYRFLKIIALKNKHREKHEVPEEEKTEYKVFSEDNLVTESTEWRGTLLRSSQTATLYYRLLESIGIENIKRVMSRIVKKQ